MTDKNPITDFSQAFKAIDPKTLFLSLIHI